MKKLNLKLINGITLISLVVTIIVLLILAGVTLNMVMGDSGIIAKARVSKRENKSSTRKRRTKIS